MRRLEFVGNGSEKFWEIDRSGSMVTVHFGRIGTKGQKQTKELGTEASAIAHVAKLIAEKSAKGYVEVTGPPQAPPMSPPAMPPQQQPEQPLRPPPPQQQPLRPLPPPPPQPPQPRRAAEPVPPDLPDKDEDTFTVPAAWLRQAEPFRGRNPAPDLKLDPAATIRAADQLRQRLEPAVRRILDNPSSDPNLVRHARTSDDPLGAAVWTVAVVGLLPIDERAQASVLADELVLRRGAAFAAEAGSLLAAVWLYEEARFYEPLADRPRWVTVAAPDILNKDVLLPVLRRLRAHLSSVGDASYAEVVERLAEVRKGPLAVRVLTSYLAPTEQDWVDDDATGWTKLRPGSTQWPLLLASATTPQQVKAILSTRWGPSFRDHPELLYSLAANVGPDAAATLASVFDSAFRTATKKLLLSLLSTLPGDAAFTELVTRHDQQYVAPVLNEAMARYPARAARILAKEATGAGSLGAACRQLLVRHLTANPGLTEREDIELDPSVIKAVDSDRRAATRAPVASSECVPPILRSPPWQGRPRAPKPAVVDGLTPPPGLTLRWEPGEQQEWAALPVRPEDWRHVFSPDWPRAVAQAVESRTHAPVGALVILAAAPPELVRPHLGSFTPTRIWEALTPTRRILARFGADAVEFTYRVVMIHPGSLATALLPIEGAAVAALMAEWLAGPRSLRPVARAWLARHPEAAARDLVPAAVGHPGKVRVAAEAALRFLDRTSGRAAIVGAAAAYGREASEAVEGVLDADPLQRLPSRIPSLPPWLDAAHLPQVLLPGGEQALPADAVATICTMFALTKPGDVYAGVEVVKEDTDPASLAAMAWGVFEQWQRAGFPAKDGWVLDGLGLVGDNDTVRRLAPLIRAWPGERGSARAIAALDVLSDIGTDVALLHLHRIAEKARFKGLKSRARAKMGEVADILGLSAEQLADRLVPTYGLDPDGSMVLDYGPRRFKVGFDEQLRPVVADEDGSRLPVLPKPTAHDDHAVATAAYASFSGLKAEVKPIASDQIRRFERAMVGGRRWTAAEHRALFVDHPLLWHLTRRLVWSAYDATDQPAGSFRVAEDRTPADSSDQAIVLDGATMVGIPHPLHLADDLTTWSDLFADYEILQPFPQLGRETYHLTDAEKAATRFSRFGGLTVPTGRLLALSHRGWGRSAIDEGVCEVVQREFGIGHWVVMDIEPGIRIGSPLQDKEQLIKDVWVNDRPVDSSRLAGNQPFSVLDPIGASELVRDLEYLRS